MRAHTSKKTYSTALASTDLNALHGELALKITRFIHEETFQPGDRLFEDRMATRIGLSRTPVRAALEFLATQGFVERQKHRGFVLVKNPPLIDEPVLAPKPDDALVFQIAADRREGRLPDQFSEQELMVRYGIPRGAVKKVLVRLCDVGLVERGLGLRYRFANEIYDAQAKAESFRFRLMVEPTALVEAEFNLPEGWIEDMQQRHQAFLGGRWTRGSSVAFFEMNMAFHEGLAAGAGNRFVSDSLHRINQRRRLANYAWSHGRDRVEQSCREHLAILDAVMLGNMKLASRLMRQHLIDAWRAPGRGRV